ncbi:MAG: hypothetical protein WC423_14380 [Vulcanimicrobiota bacterium]
MMALTGVILFMVSRLISQTMTSLKFLQEKSRTLESATLGLERLSAEFQEAIALNSTSPLSFEKVNLSAPEALANPVDEPLPATNWKRSYTSDFAGTDQTGTVIFEQTSNETLERQVSFNSANFTTVVATNVNDFVVEQAPSTESGQTGNNVFRITLTMQEQRRAISFITILTVPGLVQ